MGLRAGEENSCRGAICCRAFFEEDGRSNENIFLTLWPVLLSTCLCGPALILDLSAIGLGGSFEIPPAQSSVHFFLISQQEIAEPVLSCPLFLTASVAAE